MLTHGKPYGLSGIVAANHLIVLRADKREKRYRNHLVVMPRVPARLAERPYLLHVQILHACLLAQLSFHALLGTLPLL